MGLNRTPATGPGFPTTRRGRRATWSVLALVAAISGCAAVGPDHRTPSVDVPATFREAEGWALARPADDAPAGAWWRRYGDPRLDALVARVEVSNQTVAAAEAALRQALAVIDASRAALWPTLTAGASATRSGNLATTTGTTGVATQSVGTSSGIRDTARLTLSASWEADLWGRIRRGVEASEAGAQASAADLRAALLSAQATLVQAWLQLRVADGQRRLLADSATAFGRSLQITRDRHAAGVASRADVAQAESQLAAVRAQAVDVEIQRAQLEHAIAALAGVAPAALAVPPTDGDPLPAVPELPPVLPSRMLERRPDVAAAERAVAAANAQIGVAQAAFFPTLSLGVTGGAQASTVADLLTLPNRFWSLGPTLAASLFDAGLRRANRAQAVAAWERSVATYRQTVLVALQDAEDQLVAYRRLERELDFQREAARAAAETLAITLDQYRAGTVGFLNVATAQAARLTAERTVLDLQGRRLVASAGLVRALGGDWTAD